jgi:hypothetical protein
MIVVAMYCASHVWVLVKDSCGGGVCSARLMEQVLLRAEVCVHG